MIQIFWTWFVDGTLTEVDYSTIDSDTKWDTAPEETYFDNEEASIPPTNSEYTGVLDY